MNEDRPILVIEDDPVTLQTFRAILSDAGYHVDLARDVDTALAHVDAVDPAAIVLDLHMPRGDGLEFLRRLRAEPARTSIPVAIVTGDYLIDDRLARTIADHGAHIYFKPLWDEDLLRMIAELLPDAVPSASPRIV